jgi:hypothetical protein
MPRPVRPPWQPETPASRTPQTKSAAARKPPFESVLPDEVRREWGLPPQSAQGRSTPPVCPRTDQPTGNKGPEPKASRGVGKKPLPTVLMACTGLVALAAAVWELSHPTPRQPLPDPRSPGAIALERLGSEPQTVLPAPPQAINWRRPRYWSQPPAYVGNPCTVPRAELIVTSAPRAELVALPAPRAEPVRLP